VTNAVAPVATRRVVLVSAADEAPPPHPDSTIVVIDTAWTPGPTDRPDLVSVKPFVFDAIERHDLFEEALDRLDSWAATASLADSLIVEGVTYWFRVRESMWRWLHERLIWRHAIAALVANPTAVEFDVPATEEALLDVLRGLGATIRVVGGEALAGSSGRSGPERAGLSGSLGPLRSRLRRLWSAPVAVNGRVAEAGDRDRLLAERVRALTSAAVPRVVVLTTPSTYQRIGSGEQADLRDPNLGPVIERLPSVGLDPIVMGMGLDHREDEDWRTIAGDDRMLPQSLMRVRWAAPADEQRVVVATQTCEAALAAARTVPLMADGLDLAPALVDSLRPQLQQVVATNVRQLARIERLVAELRPAGILLTQEGSRTPWLVAGARASVPVFALQHGVLYPTHPGYPNRRHPALVLASRTFVYGDYERRVLLAGAYRTDEVEVSGSPRLDMLAAASAPAELAREREDVRRELGVAGDDRLLVVSTVNLGFVRRFHLVHMVERLLGGPLPGIHVVFKQHPGERDPGPYGSLLVGLALAGGYEPPPFTVIRDIDLYRLLRAADAHVGLHSTVLTDAVASGTPNLIALVEGHADLLGYVPSGVARPVADVADLRDALDGLRTPDTATRQAFLDDHFRPGDASGRIAEAIAERLATAPRQQVLG
jgi:hypothetical protein